MSTKRRQTKIINLSFDETTRTSSQYINIPYNVDHVILKNFSFLSQYPTEFDIALLSSNMFKDPCLFFGPYLNISSTSSIIYDASTPPNITGSSIGSINSYSQINCTYNINLFCEIKTENINNTFEFYISDRAGSYLVSATGNLDIILVLQLEFVEK